MLSKKASTPVRAALAIGLLGVLAACSANPDKMANPGLANNATPGSTQDFVVNVGDRVFFDTDSSDINPSSQATLDKQALWLNQYGNYRVAIEGHADERGTREYNIALGARRANSVRNYLVSKGIASNRLMTKSFGKERPVAVCNDISCWSQNRRAVTVLSN
ncbi:peptidoglycan-associated lipoprotein Pal [Cohaesibacter gelatinilyticus]|uniref:Peptidoglycan-associated lipoprotein n=1 Tax=Cohaesibacter gelatinilyticus TaxID=372072 RepID=A0A285PI48_9HYPH|nr:peptidoglycan-associated lipoprotein Pal [Cohaesibacter gelatinilyticus]SNZ21098.1 peptidoglycan-associated lipoprotein [Cohaesibacter gelatinilyticus]